MAPSPSTVTGHVDNGQGGSADCTIDLEVKAAAEEVSAPVVLEKTLALHSIYFPTDQPTAQNPDGGLVESQQTILRTLAEDFKKYLELKPDAHLTLEGHADERASVLHNDALAERRVALSKRFLVELGVPEANIETHSFGEHEQLDDAQVHQQIEENPDLTSQERQELFANMKSIILAQNRRVDIVLSTTGQTSTRQYPFNAKDALTLLRDKALEH
ncbi:MAG TPA: OmpA family protein [Terriglobia bacterium]|nr:OmpA family protein [Terriglobia bacterium]